MAVIIFFAIENTIPRLKIVYPEKLKAEIANKLGALKKEEEKYILLV